MREVVCISGASSGIGKAFAQLYGKENDLFLLGRNTQALEELKREIENGSGHHVEIFSADLTAAGGPESIYAEAQKRDLFVGTLINNAGFGIYGDFTENRLGDCQKMIDLNDRALVTLTWLFLQDMREKGKGAILNVASIASFFPGPYMAVYYASKAFVLSFSRALKEEVRKDGIVVSCLCPGPVATNFAETAGAQQARFFSSSLVHSADRVALYGKYLLDHKRAYGTEGFLNKTGVFLAGLLPSPLNAKIIGYVQSLKNKI